MKKGDCHTLNILYLSFQYIVSLDSLSHMVSRRAASFKRRFPTTSLLIHPRPDNLASCPNPEDRCSDLKHDDVEDQTSHASTTQIAQTSPQRTVNLDRNAEIITHHSSAEDIQTVENVVEGRINDPTQMDVISSRASLSSETTTSSLLTSISRGHSLGACTHPTRQFSVTCQII